MISDKEQTEGGEITIAKLIRGIDDREYFLPSLQREFVWSREQIERLFDSLMRKFPIGSLLFWQLKRDELKDFTFYKFLHDCSDFEGGRNNAKLESQEIETLKDLPVRAVLDGQQRMNALYIGLMGSYSEKIKNKPKNAPDSYEAKQLYINLLKLKEPDDIKGMVYDFQFLTADEAKNVAPYTDHYWFKVGDILDLSKEDAPEVADDNGLGKGARRILNQLHDRIHAKDNGLHYYLVKGAELDDALNIFIRVNNGGKVVKPSDLMLSFVTTNLHGKHDVREELNDFLKEVNKIKGETKFALDKDTVLKAFLFLSDGDVHFKVQNFKDNMGFIDANWDKLLDAIRLTVRLINSFGFNKEHFASNNSLIPIAYYIYKHNNTEHLKQDNKKFGGDWERIRWWFIVANIKGIFGKSGDTTLNRLQGILKDKVGDGFPLWEMLASDADTVNVEAIIDNIITEVTDVKYKDKTVKLALATFHDQKIVRDKNDVDHMFPKSKFKDADEVNSLANLQLLSESENKSKGNTDFYDWVKGKFGNSETELNKQYRINHCVPTETLKFEDFLKAREAIIRKAIREGLERLI